MPTIDVAMARSLRGESTWEILSQGIKRSFTRRDIASTVSTKVTDFKTAVSSWDNCMSVTWCKWPLIGLMIVGALIIIGIIWCIIRCLCCGLSCCCECCYCLKCCGNCMGCCDSPRGKNKHKYLDDPYIPPHHQQNTGYQMQPQMKAPATAASTAPSTSFNSAPPIVPQATNHPKSGPPQYAEFEVSKKGDEDALPAMPVWEDSNSKKVALEVALDGDDAVELEQLKKPEPVAPSPAPTAAMGARVAAVRQGNFRGTPPPMSPYGPPHPQQDAYGRSVTPASAYNQDRNGPGYGNQPGRNTPGFGNPQAGYNQRQGSMDSYGQSHDPYAPQNSAYNAPANNGYQGMQNTGYQQDMYQNSNKGYSQPQQHNGYDQVQDNGYNSYTNNTMTNGAYGINNALPSPQESAFHYDSPSYQQATSQTGNTYDNNVYPQEKAYGQEPAFGQEASYGQQYGQQQQQTGAYNTMTSQMPVPQPTNNPYDGQTEIYEMPAANYEGPATTGTQNTGGYTQQQPSGYGQQQPAGYSQTPQGQAQTQAQQYSAFNGANSPLQNTAGFDFNSGFSRPGTASGPQAPGPQMAGYDVQRQGSVPPQELYATNGQNSQGTMYAAPKPYRPNPAWATQ